MSRKGANVLEVVMVAFSPASSIVLYAENGWHLLLLKDLGFEG